MLLYVAEGALSLLWTKFSMTEVFSTASILPSHEKSYYHCRPPVSYKILKIEEHVDFNWFPSSSGMLVNGAPSNSSSFNNLNFVNNKTQRFRWEDIELLDYDSTSFLDMFKQNSVLRPWKEQLHASSDGAGRF
ncbi:hypothetical protein V6N11_046941 [Hibiscus sabdariffa]|uniref:Uncharacterized protein n=1 Tax=Hibiscus sabdariffa TaxID=183260 RepID=A0ABR2ND45_9ROSI